MYAWLPFFVVAHLVCGSIAAFLVYSFSEFNPTKPTAGAMVLAFLLGPLFLVAFLAAGIYYRFKG